jgi:hypothetical protein
LDGPLPKLCPAVTLSHQDGRHSSVALLLKAALIQVSDCRLPAYFDRKHMSGLYFLHSFNQLNQIILITVQNVFLLLGRDIKVIRTKASRPPIFHWNN